MVMDVIDVQVPFEAYKSTARRFPQMIFMHKIRSIFRLQEPILTFQALQFEERHVKEKLKHGINSVQCRTMAKGTAPQMRGSLARLGCKDRTKLDHKVIFSMDNVLQHLRRMKLQK